MTKIKKIIIGIGSLAFLIVVTSVFSEPKVSVESNIIPVQPISVSENPVTSKNNLSEPVPTSTIPPKKIQDLNETSSDQKCHPSYSGCLNPDASDYDCVGGSGNGPYYTGRVHVIGSDVFGLDRDGDGWGCE